MQKRPVKVLASCVKIRCAASPMISGVRLRRVSSSPPSRFCTAAVAIVVRGHSALAAMPSPLSSPDRPSAMMLMLNLAMV